jgi:hypothetical protein
MPKNLKAIGAATAGRTVTLQAIKRLVAIANFSETDSVDFVLGSATITLAPADSAAQPAAALIYTDGTANGLFRSAAVSEVALVVRSRMSDTQPLDLNSNPLGIGRHVSGIADPFNGHIDEFRSRTSSGPTAGSRPPGTT